MRNEFEMGEGEMRRVTLAITWYTLKRMTKPEATVYANWIRERETVSYVYGEKIE